MKRRTLWAALLGAALALGCGTPAGLPPPGGGDGKPPPDTEPPADGAKSLWPLTEGSTWTYRITDGPLVFEKTVEVLGVRPLPGSGSQAVAVRSVQPDREELSWQVVQDGQVFRVREEDSRGGVLLRATRWEPHTMKALEAGQPGGWTHSESVTETVSDASGAVLEVKEKAYQWTVQATGLEVASPAGTFEGAIKLQRVRTDKADWERTYWLVPGVGKVREEGERLEELIRYEIK